MLQSYRTQQLITDLNVSSTISSIGLGVKQSYDIVTFELIANQYCGVGIASISFEIVLPAAFGPMVM